MALPGTEHATATQGAVQDVLAVMLTFTSDCAKASGQDMAGPLGLHDSPHSCGLSRWLLCCCSCSCSWCHTRDQETKN